MPDIIINPSGLISGDEVRNAMTGPHGSVVESIPSTTAVVPQAQNGVNAPTATLARIETLVLLSRNRLTLSVSMYTFSNTAVIIARLSGSQLWPMVANTVVTVLK